MQRYDKRLAADPAEWDAFVASHSDAHILQTSDWGRLKSAFGLDHATIEIERGECADAPAAKRKA